MKSGPQRARLTLFVLLAALAWLGQSVYATQTVNLLDARTVYLRY